MNASEFQDGFCKMTDARRSSGRNGETAMGHTGCGGVKLSAGGLLILALFSPWALADTSTKSPEHGYRLQETDQEAPPLSPVKPRTESTQRQLDAMSWFMTGRVW